MSKLKMSKLNFSSLLALPVILLLGVLLAACGDKAKPVTPECSFKDLGVALKNTYTITGVTATGAAGSVTGAAAVWNTEAKAGKLTIAISVTAGDDNCAYVGTFKVEGRPVVVAGVEPRHINAVLPAEGSWTVSDATAAGATINVGSTKYTFDLAKATLNVTVAAVTSASNRENVVDGAWTFTLAPKVK